MQCYHFLFVVGCWLMLCVTDALESRPSAAALSPGVNYLPPDIDLADTCRKERRGYYTRKRCPRQRTPKARCRSVKCPFITCLEKSFLKTMAEIQALPQSLKKPGTKVTVRKVPPGTKIRLRQSRAKRPLSRPIRRRNSRAVNQNNFQAVLQKKVTKRQSSTDAGGIGTDLGCGK